MEALLELGGWEGAAAMILSFFKDSERQRRGEGGRGKDGDVERLKAGVGGRLEGLQRWRWGGGGGGGVGQMQQFALESRLEGCVFLCVCVLGRRDSVKADGGIYYVLWLRGDA